MTASGDNAATPGARRQRRLTRTITLVAAALLAMLLLVAGLTRYGVLLPQVQLLIEARTDGLKLGRLGRLKIEGISGDLWRDVRARRLTIRDEQGVWLEARNVHLSWRYAELLRRRFDADLVEADSIRVLRRPTLAPKSKDRGLPLSFQIDQGRARLQLEPAFSERRGDFDLAFALKVERAGDRNVVLRAASRLHPGDFLDLNVDMRRQGALRLAARAQEARGGALAGALGFPSDRAFDLELQAGGTTSQGRFTAKARSGAVSPLLASGAWTPQGGQAGGRVDLGASRLTAPWAERLGEQVRFGIGGTRVRSGDFALDARVNSEALAVHARGLGDLGKQRIGAEGLRLDIRTPSLSRITGGPTMGAAQVAGVLTGQITAWRFVGAGSAIGPQLPGYRLAKVSGPLELSHTRGDFLLKTRLLGAGGSGSGFAAAILGGAPTATISARRTAAGQLLLEQLDLVGRGLKIQASGGRSVFGALNVKAQAEISNLAAARLGAAGGLRLNGVGSQASAGAAWRLSVDATGQGFAVGVAEADRLLGPRPRLEVDAAWAAGRLAVSKARLHGAAVQASGSGTLASDGALGLKLDWNASGPFRAGPVEVTGRMSGTGGVSGTVTSPRLEVAAALEHVDLPRLPLSDARVSLVFQRQTDGDNGMASLTAASAYGPARAQTDFRFQPGGVDLTSLVLDAGGVKADGSLSLRRNSPSAADLRLNIGRGAFLDAGTVTGLARITDGVGGARAQLSLRAEGVRTPGSTITIRSARVTADGPLANLPFVAEARGASGQGAWTVTGAGAVTDAAPGYRLAFNGAGKLGGRDLHTVEAAVFRIGGDEQSARVRLQGSDGGKLDLDGRLKDGAADVRAQVTQMGLNLFDPDFDGRIDAVVVARGQGGRLDGTLDAQLTGARGRGAPASQGIDGTLKGLLADSTITLDLATNSAQGLKASASVILPAEASASPFRIAIARQRPIRGRFFAEGEVRPLWELAIGGERALSGHVRTEGTLAGSLIKPLASGRIAVERGRFDDGASGLSLRDVTLGAVFDQDAVTVSEARGIDGRGGSLSGQGRVSLARDGVSSFKLDLRGFRLIDNETATAVATGPATINRGADGKVRLTGDLTIDRADVAADPPVPSGVVAMDVRELNRPDDLPLAFAGARKRGEGIALDVTLKAPRRVFLRGRGLAVEFSLDAHVGGTTTNADLTGRARVVRGDYDFAGKRFEIDDTSVVYLSAKPQNIRLQLDAVREDPSLKVTVRIRGTAARPEVTLASSPSLPNDEVLAKVLFERSASQLSPVEAAQLASALSSLAGGGGLDVIGNLKSFAGLDRLAFGGSQESGVTVSGGKYVSDDIYIELTGGGREGPSAQVEWRVRKTLSILSRLTGQSDNRVAVRWRKDY